MRVTVVGAGVAGLCCAVELAERGAIVEVIERGETLGDGSCSWYAGGMLAPWCERENAEALVTRLGVEAIDWWSRRHPGTVRAGSLVVAHGRDRAELKRFAQRTQGYRWVARDQLGEIEPDLTGRFEQALLFAEEAHLDPRAALSSLVAKLGELNVPIRFGVDLAHRPSTGQRIVDCTGLAARHALPELRGVKGEMLVLRSRDLTLNRPVRVLHPRIPLYIVPRGAGVFMVGATMVESDDARGVTARSVLELLSAAYALHPAFGEAEIVEIGAHVRPAFPDNLPRLRSEHGTLYVNGFYRHGFLLAPALARMAAEVLLSDRDPNDLELNDESARERRMA